MPFRTSHISPLEFSYSVQATILCVEKAIAFLLVFLLPLRSAFYKWKL